MGLNEVHAFMKDAGNFRNGSPLALTRDRMKTFNKKNHTLMQLNSMRLNGSNRSSPSKRKPGDAYPKSKFKNQNDLLQNNGIFFSLLAIKFAHQIAYEK